MEKVSASALERARYCLSRVKYSDDKIKQIDKAAENLPDVSVLAGSKPTEYSFVMALPNGYSVKCRGLSE